MENWFYWCGRAEAHYGIFGMDKEKTLLIQKTLQKYKHLSDELNKKEIESWNKIFKKHCPVCKQSVNPTEEESNKHKDISRGVHKQHGRIKREMLNDNIVSFLVCDTHIVWRAKLGECNYDIENRLSKKFPMMVTDTESDQGFAYINNRFINDVRDYLANEENLVENEDSGFATFYIKTDVEVQESSGLDDDYYIDLFIVQWNWSGRNTLIGKS